MDITDNTSLHVCAVHLPEYSSILAERDELHRTAVSELSSAIDAQDSILASRALRRVEQLSDSLISLSPQENAQIIKLCCKMGFQTDWEWLSVWVAGKALKVAARLLTPRTPALTPLISDDISWDKLLSCARAIHVFPDTETSCRTGSDEALRFHAEHLGTLCRRARFYQKKGAAEAVCNELERYILKEKMDHDKMQESHIFLFMLYPGSVVNDDPHIENRLRDWIEAWGRIDNTTEWDAAWFGLVRRLAKTKKADFVPYLSILYGRIYAALKLSANGSLQDQVTSQRFYSAWQSALGRTTCVVKAAKLLIEILHVGDSPKRFEHLMMTVRTFIHPSNQGLHAERLATFLSTLCESFAKRLGNDLNLGINELSQDTKVRFIEAIFPLIEMGLNSKSLSVVSASQAALRHLAWVAPSTLADKTLTEIIRSGLDPANLTRSHQAPAALKALTVLIQPLVYSGGAARAKIIPYLVEFLEQSLPGIDPNDTRKTAITMMMAYSVLSCVPLVDTSNLDRKQILSPTKCSESYAIDVPNSNQGDQNDSDLWEYGSSLTDWGFSFFRRLFTLAQARGKRAKKGMSAQLDIVLDYFYAETSALCLFQMDAASRSRAIQEIAKFLLEEGALPEAQSEALALSRACARADPELALKIFITPLSEQIDEKADSRKVSWALVVLGGLIRFSGGHNLLHFSSTIEAIIYRSFGHKDGDVRKLGAKLIRRYSRALLDTYIIRDIKYEDELLFDQMQGTWGSYDGDWRTVKVSWHLPSKEEIDRATTFLVNLKNKLLAGILESDSKELFHEELTEKERLQHRLFCLSQLIRGTLTHMDLETFALTRLELIAQVLVIFEKLQPTTNTAALKVVIKCLSLLGSFAKGPRGAGAGEYVRAFQMWSAWLREISQSRAHEAGARARYRLEYSESNIGTGAVPALLDRVEPRHVMIGHIETLRQRRIFQTSFIQARSLRSNPELIRPFEQIGDALNQLCFHPFSSVRICAQRHRSFVDSRFPWLGQRRLLELTIPNLGLSSQGIPEFFTGAVYICGSDSNVFSIARKWQLFSKFLVTVVCESGKSIENLPVHRQAKAQERVAKLLHGVLQKWHLYPKSMVPKGEMGQLLLCLSTFGNDSTVHWRRQLGACAVVGILIDPRFENEIPRETVNFIVNMSRCEILPSRTVALSVLRRLLLCGDSVKLLVSYELSNKSTDFWHLAGATLAEDRNSAAAEDQQADWSVGVGEFIKLVRSIVKRPKFPKGRFDPSAPKDFHSPKCDFWAALADLKYSGENTLDTIALPTLRKLAWEGESNKERMIRRMAACELFAGCLSVRPEWSSAFFPILTRTLAELPNASNWCDAVSFIAFFSPDQGAALLQELNKEAERNQASRDNIEPETEGEKERGYAYTSNLLKVIGSLVLDRRNPIPEDLFLRFEKSLLHSYKSVRQSAATGLAAFSVFQLVRHEVAVQAILNAVVKSKDGLEAGLLFVAVICALGESRRLLETLIIPLVGPVVFQAQGHEDVETANLARNVLSIVAHLKCYSVPKQAVELEQIICQQFSKHSEWPKRRSVPVFLRVFHSQHSCLLLGMGAGALVQRTAEELLMDTQAEVRDAARLLLLALLAAAPPESLISARDRYFKMISRPEPSRKKQGVLALTALVEACPYNVPPAVPESLIELSKHVNGVNGAQVRKTLSEFKRTHVDEWTTHKKAFSEEQLNSFEGVLVSPDYYA